MAYGCAISVTHNPDIRLFLQSGFDDYLYGKGFYALSVKNSPQI
jgi:hypothetical protein